MSAEQLTAALQPALDAYGAALAEHRHDYDTWGNDLPACTCGWKPSRPGRSARRAVGLHIAAAEKRAEKTYDAAAAAIVANLHGQE